MNSSRGQKFFEVVNKKQTLIPSFVDIVLPLKFYYHIDYKLNFKCRILMLSKVFYSSIILKIGAILIEFELITVL